MLIGSKQQLMRSSIQSTDSMNNPPSSVGDAYFNQSDDWIPQISQVDEDGNLIDDIQFY